MLGNQARGAVLLEAARQTKQLAPSQTDQLAASASRKSPHCTRSNTSSRLNFSWLIDTTGTADPGGSSTPASVMSTLQRGVISILRLHKNCAVWRLWKIMKGPSAELPAFGKHHLL
jgi:hypothetical protein